MSPVSACSRQPLRAALLLFAFALPAARAAEPPAALEILTRSVSFRSLPGNGQVPAYAAYLRTVLVEAGFPADDVRVEPFGQGADATATLTARLRGTDASLRPMLLLGHMDVVDARREDWQRDPFVATVEKGYVY